jgi:hypothetical protein
MQQGQVPAAHAVTPQSLMAGGIAPQSVLSSVMAQQAYPRQMEPFAIDPAMAAYAAYMQGLQHGMGSPGYNRVW